MCEANSFRDDHEHRNKYADVLTVITLIISKTVVHGNYVVEVCSITLDVSQVGPLSE